MTWYLDCKSFKKQVKRYTAHFIVPLTIPQKKCFYSKVFMNKQMKSKYEYLAWLLKHCEM